MVDIQHQPECFDFYKKPGSVVHQHPVMNIYTSHQHTVRSQSRHMVSLISHMTFVSQRSGIKNINDKSYSVYQYPQII